jgi:hypothetical protein
VDSGVLVAANLKFRIGRGRLARLHVLRTSDGDAAWCAAACLLAASLSRHLNRPLSLRQNAYILNFR